MLKAYLVRENTQKLLHYAFWVLTLNVQLKRVGFRRQRQTLLSKLQTLLKFKVIMKSSQETYLHFKNVHQLWAAKCLATTKRKICWDDGGTSWSKLILILSLGSTSSTSTSPTSLSALISLKCQTSHYSPASEILFQKLSQPLFLQVLLGPVIPKKLTWREESNLTCFK